MRTVWCRRLIVRCREEEKRRKRRSDDKGREGQKIKVMKCRGEEE